MGVNDESIAERRRKLFVYAETFGLDRDDRIAFSEMLLRRDISSWKDLTSSQVDRLLDAFDGALLLKYLTELRD